MCILTLYRPTACPPRVPPRPEKLEIGGAMRLKQVTRRLPAELFSQQLFKGSREGDVRKSWVWTGTRVPTARTAWSSVLSLLAR